LLIQRISGNEGKPVLKKLLPELRIRESCGFAQFVASGHSRAKLEAATAADNK
jgi:hypothetical protein